MDMRAVINVQPNPKVPRLAPGDTVKVSFKIREGQKERSQQFQGVIISIREGLPAGNFTVRRATQGTGVERTFFFQSPIITKVEVLRHGKVRRAKLFYLRRLSTKASRLKERKEVAAEKTAIAGATPTGEAETAIPSIQVEPAAPAAGSTPPV